MKSLLPLLVLLATGLWSGCATPGQSYARQHPDLPPQHLQILTTGKIPNGDAVAGLTREQVRLALGMEPTQYTKVEGLDAWVFVRKQLPELPMGSSADFDRRGERNPDLVPEDPNAPREPVESKTTVFFQGDRALRAEVVKGGL